MTSNMWSISLLDEGVSNTIPTHSDGAMITELGSMPITEGFSKIFYECETTGKLIQFYHTIMGYPCKYTWCKAITAGYFKVWPVLTAAHVHRFIKVV